MENETRAEMFERCYRLYRNMLYRICIVYLKNEADAEDAIHDTFLRLMERDIRFQTAEHEKAWLIVVAGNICKDRLRHWSRRQCSVDELAGQLASNDPEPETGEILSLILHLPERLILPVYLYYYEGYRTADIARMLNLNPSTLRNRLREARLLLRTKWKED